MVEDISIKQNFSGHHQIVTSEFKACKCAEIYILGVLRASLNSYPNLTYKTTIPSKQVLLLYNDGRFLMIFKTICDVYVNTYCLKEEWLP